MTKDSTYWSPKGTGFIDSTFTFLKQFDSRLFISTQNGLYYSDDFGDNWQKVVDAALGNDTINNLEKHDNLLYAFTNRSVFTSSTSGSSWQKMTNPPNDTTVTSFMFYNDKTIATSGLGFLVYNNSQWSYLGNGLKTKMINAFAQHNGTIYAGTNGNLYKSIDKGNTWSALTNGIEKQYINTFAFKGDTILVGTYNHLLKSTDNGITWIDSVSSIFHKRYISNIFVHNSRIIVSREDSIFISYDNAESWDTVKTWTSKKRSLYIFITRSKNYCRY